jgi:dihydropteroate synthase
MSLSFPIRNGRSIETPLPAFIMGILNATPDSFWEGSRAEGVSAGLGRALALIRQGADIIDIGGESTRPGASYVDAEEEISRVVPLVRAIRNESPIPISVDTRKAAVMEAALEAGADICNDISALEDDPDMARLVARAGVPVILMHKRGIPVSMQENPVYNDPVREVRDYLRERAKYAEDQGIARDRIVLDPGIGFGKRYADNRALIAGLGDIVGLGYPVLMALSRKSCIGEMTGRAPSERLAGSLAANLVSVRRGATFLRVHDVAETRDMLSVLQEIG